VDDTPAMLLAHLSARRDAMVGALGALVCHESPSLDKPALDALGSDLADRFRAAGLAAERLPNPDGGDHLRLTLDGSDGATPPALVLGHFDTVWPAGTLARLPFRVEGGRAFGPGSYDMKAGLVLIEFALGAIRDLGLRLPRPLVVLLTSDEEVGSPTSRRFIEAEAPESAYALVPEPPLADGRLKTARSGVGRFALEVTGKSAHAGVEPEKGVNAVVELAHQILAAAALADPARGTTVTAGLVRGGTTPNVVPGSAQAVFDVRATTAAEAARVERGLRGLGPVLPGASLAVEGGFNRPPMERGAKTAALFGRAREIGRSLGMELGEGSTGGGSDGNFTAAAGLPTLDGLGAPGAGAHADHEHVLVDHLAPRAALLAALLLRL